MTKYAEIYQDLKAILQNVPGVNKVEFGRPDPIVSENTFTAAYILPDTDSFDLVRMGSTQIDAYNTKIYARIFLNINSETDDLYWIQIRHDVINHVLYDDEIWSNLIDRDIVSVVYDDGGTQPLWALEILFEFTLKEECFA